MRADGPKEITEPRGLFLSCVPWNPDFERELDGRVPAPVQPVQPAFYVLYILGFFVRFHLGRKDFATKKKKASFEIASIFLTEGRVLVQMSDGVNWAPSAWICTACAPSLGHFPFPHTLLSAKGLCLQISPG